MDRLPIAVKHHGHLLLVEAPARDTEVVVIPLRRALETTVVTVQSPGHRILVILGTCRIAGVDQILMGRPVTQHPPLHDVAVDILPIQVLRLLQLRLDVDDSFHYFLVFPINSFSLALLGYIVQAPDGPSWRLLLLLAGNTLLSFRNFEQILQQVLVITLDLDHPVYRLQKLSTYNP